jgi:hypothetical protein
MGFNPAQQEKGALLYWLDNETYKPLTSDDWETIQKGTARL